MKINFVVCNLLVFLMVFTGCSLKASKQDIVSADHGNSKNTIVEYNNNLSNLLKEKIWPNVNLTGSPVAINGEDGSAKYLEEKTIMILDEQLGNTIIANLFLDETLFESDEEGSYYCSVCLCIPDVAIEIISGSDDDAEIIRVSYFYPGTIQSSIHFCERPLDKKKSEKLNNIFSELGLLNQNER